MDVIVFNVDCAEIADIKKREKQDHSNLYRKLDVAKLTLTDTQRMLGHFANIVRIESEYCCLN